MRIIDMEKEKRKGRSRSRSIIFGIVTVILLIAGGRWAWSYYISPGHSLSEFSRFESAEEVVAFLHEHFDLYVTTSADIRTFMAAYPLEYGGCQDSNPIPGAFEGYVVNEKITNIMNCSVPTWAGFAGTYSYNLAFYINTDDKLEYIGAWWGCACL
jgi:hypothetical protein